MERKLRRLYEQWHEELLEKCSALLDEGYSNPHYVSIPENWGNSRNRIMLVGEEGHGKWGAVKNTAGKKMKDLGR